MNIYQMLAQAERQAGGEPGYAWRIDRDHLYEGSPKFWDEIGVGSAVGVIGPSDARLLPDEDVDTAWYPYRHQFRMYDDDGELYYTGTLFWEGSPEPEEHQLYGPLGDYGGGSGCVSIKYRGKPEWDCS